MSLLDVAVGSRRWMLLLDLASGSRHWTSLLDLTLTLALKPCCCQISLFNLAVQSHCCVQLLLSLASILPHRQHSLSSLSYIAVTSLAPYISAHLTLKCYHVSLFNSTPPYHNDYQCQLITPVYFSNISFPCCAPLIHVVMTSTSCQDLCSRSCILLSGLPGIPFLPSSLACVGRMRVSLIY